MTYAERRRKLKAGILADLSESATAEAWGSWVDHASDLGLTDSTLGSVMDEIGQELWRRATRLSTSTDRR